MALLLGFLLIPVLLYVPSSLAFHEHIGECQDGVSGYLAAHLDGDGQVILFLSSTQRASDKTILCQIDPEQQVKILGRAKRA